MKLRHKANALLAGCAIGAAITFPLSSSGINTRILFHALMAATVGGIADWFAVNALFRAPLGITWRTNILRRNRKRLENALTDFLTRDILSEENIKNALADENTALVLKEWLDTDEGREKLFTAAHFLFLRTLRNIDTEKLSSELHPLLRKFAESIEIKEYLARIGGELLKEPMGERVIALVAKTVKNAVMSDIVGETLESGIVKLFADYKAQSKLRKLLPLEKIFPPSELAERLQGKIYDELTITAARESVSNEFFVRLLAKKAKELLEDGETQKSARNRLRSLFEHNLSEEKLKLYIDELLHEEETTGKAFASIKKLLEKEIGEFCQSEERQRECDALIKSRLIACLEGGRGMINQLIDEELASISDDELIAKIEETTLDDLQMIRLNGTLVGFAAGALLSCVVLFAERLGGV